MMVSRAGPGAAAVALCFAAAVAAAQAANPFTSNVVALTNKNFRELEKSPHVWFVNICRSG